ncbi:hypothetical protein B0J15DRAFT_37689 [Fusarium solani]|uniref:Xylanolytic transcriptional activator regulatory domain-containing protein n=1 Tax=Fusarium solani TaxID=169388 RepID=A0A9P9H8Q7_FUSSL|nr:uncharacterized protein B0J15DRAFT_37689 [Fusarium solani]KAH7253068.1 hypothetical protein B0J15DRAFT_37689 [Fusarium solani]
METDEQVSPQSSHAPVISEQGVALGELGFAGMLSTPEALMPAFSPNTWRQLLPVVRPRQSHDDPDLPARARDVPSGNEEAYITIPVGHHTTTSSLFSLQSIRNLVGYYPPSLFYDIESSQSFSSQLELDQGLSPLLARLDLDRESTTPLVSNFFSYIHPKFPVVDQESFPELFERTFRVDCNYDADLAVCLLVLALGELGSTESAVDPSQDMPGMSYFGLAYRILMMQWAASFSPSLSLPTGLILAGVYLCFKAQPLAAWKMACMASNSLQLLAQQPTADVRNANENEMLSRLCWTCFVIECDSLSEFHLPRSGIEVAIDRMYFPRLGNHTDRDGLMFLALCSIRRLLNRIHNAVYASGTKEALSPSSSPTLPISDPTGQQSALSVLMSLEGVFGELERQLDVWYDSLPDIIKPDLSTTVPQDTQDAWLRLRYWSAKHIISRPSLIYATTWPDGHGLPGFVARYSAMCTESSRNYIKTGVYTLDKRTHYSWMTIQACLSNSLILSMAATTPKLQHLVPDIDSILRETPDRIQPWASRDSSAEAVGLILRTLHHKMKFYTSKAR